MITILLDGEAICGRAFILMGSSRTHHCVLPPDHPPGTLCECACGKLRVVQLDATVRIHALTIPLEEARVRAETQGVDATVAVEHIAARRAMMTEEYGRSVSADGTEVVFGAGAVNEERAVFIEVDGALYAIRLSDLAHPLVHLATGTRCACEELDDDDVDHSRN